MDEVGIIGVDLAKHVFQLHGARADGSVAFRRKLRRAQLLAFLAVQPGQVREVLGIPVTVRACWEAGWMVVGGLVLGAELLSEGVDLAALELGEADPAPALGGAGHGAEHELEDGALTEGVGDDLQPATLLDEQALEEVRGSDRAAMGDRVEVGT